MNSVYESNLKQNQYFRILIFDVSMTEKSVIPYFVIGELELLFFFLRILNPFKVKLITDQTRVWIKQDELA